MLVFGCAVYMGSVTAEFKAFMDASSQRWFNRKWHGKWSAGFANSGGLSGDKLAYYNKSVCLPCNMAWTGLVFLSCRQGIRIKISIAYPAFWGWWPNHSMHRPSKPRPKVTFKPPLNLASIWQKWWASNRPNNWLIRSHRNRVIKSLHCLTARQSHK